MVIVSKKTIIGGAIGVNAWVLISSLFGSLILYLIDIKALPDWGWRLAFILALIT